MHESRVEAVGERLMRLLYLGWIRPIVGLLTRISVEI